MHAHVSTHTHARTREHTHPPTHPPTPTHAHPHTNTHMSTHTCEYTHTHTHAHTHSHTVTHTVTHAQSHTQSHTHTGGRVSPWSALCGATGPVPVPQGQGPAGGPPAARAAPLSGSGPGQPGTRVGWGGRGVNRGPGQARERGVRGPSSHTRGGWVGGGRKELRQSNIC